MTNQSVLTLAAGALILSTTCLRSQELEGDPTARGVQMVAERVQALISTVQAAKERRDIMELVGIAIQLNYLERLAGTPQEELRSSQVIRDAEALLDDQGLAGDKAFLAKAVQVAKLEVNRRDQGIEEFLRETEEEGFGYGGGSVALTLPQAKEVLGLFWPLPTGFAATRGDCGVAQRLLTEGLQASCGVGYSGKVRSTPTSRVLKAVGNSLTLADFVKTLDRETAQSLKDCRDEPQLVETAVDGVAYQWAPFWRVRQKTGSWQ